MRSGYLEDQDVGGKIVLKWNFKKYEGWNFNSGNYLFTTDTIYE